MTYLCVVRWGWEGAKPMGAAIGQADRCDTSAVIDAAERLAEREQREVSAMCGSCAGEGCHVCGICATQPPVRYTVQEAIAAGILTIQEWSASAEALQAGDVLSLPTTAEV